MLNKIKDELEELLAHKVISEETASAIASYYQYKENQAPSKLLIVFGIFGALLGGLGIILVFAHNWDEFSVGTKCVLSLLPLLIGQVLCGFTLFKKPDSVAWRESSAVFLFFAVGASISLIAQTYNISGDFPSFVMTWMLLCLPLVYVMKSQVTSLLYLIGITVFCINKSYFHYPKVENHTYWLLLLGIAPNYYLLIKNQFNNNFTSLHHWFITISITIGIGSLTSNNANETLLIYSFVLLFSCFYLIGKLPLFSALKLVTNSYALVGKIGLLYLLFMFSFRWFWEDIENNKINISSVVFGVVVGLFALASFLLYQSILKKRTTIDNLIQYVFLDLLLLFFINQMNVITVVVLTNFYLLFIGIKEISKGNTENSLARMNFGILIVAILVTCRFFDTEMSFVIRGILFILVGIGFLALNYFMLRKKRQNGY
jgi:uncharacterized membrane protein